MEQKRKPGRPPKNPVDPNMVKSRKYPMNPDPNLNFIRAIVVRTLEEDNKPFVDLGDINTQYAQKYGAVRNALRTIAEELGVTV